MISGKYNYDSYSAQDRTDILTHVCLPSKIAPLPCVLSLHSEAFDRWISTRSLLIGGPLARALSEKQMFSRENRMVDSLSRKLLTWRALTHRQFTGLVLLSNSCFRQKVFENFSKVKLLSCNQ